MQSTHEIERAALERVRDEESFVAFIRLLADDKLRQEQRSGPNAGDDWEHGTIGH